MTKTKTHKNYIRFSIYSFILFGLLAYMVFSSDIIRLLDLKVSSYFFSIQNSFLTYIMFLINWITAPVMLVIAVIFAIISLVGRYKHLEAIILISSIGFGAVVTWCLKNILAISRPDTQLVSALSEYAFPSGHTTMSVIFFFLIAIFIGSHVFNKYRDEFVFFCAFAVILIGISRLYLGVHWFSDVVGGLLLGLSISFLGLYCYEKLKTQKQFWTFGV